MGNHPLTLSDRVEIFTIDTSKYPPEVIFAIFISDPSFRIYKVFESQEVGSSKNLSVFF